MLNFLFKRETNNAELLNDFYSKIREMYSFESISEERKEYLKSTMAKYGYLPYPHIKALEELSNAEVLWALESKWENEGVFKDGKFDFEKHRRAVFYPLRYWLLPFPAIPKDQQTRKYRR